MSKFIKRTCSVLLGVILVFLISNDSICQTKSTSMLDKKIDLNLKEMDLLQVCSMLADFAYIPIGLERTMGYTIGDGNHHIQIKSGTLKEILDSLISQEPSYSWEIRDGVVNIYPIKERDKFLKLLLETEIESFSSKTKLAKTVIAKDISDSDEIRLFLSSQQIRFRILTANSNYAPDEITEIDASNTELRGILNKVIKLDF